MCIRVQYAPRDKITDPLNRAENLIVLPEELGTVTLYALRALRAVLRRLDIPQDHFGALCWCGEEIALVAHTSQQQNEVIHLGA